MPEAAVASTPANSAPKGAGRAARASGDPTAGVPLPATPAAETPASETAPADPSSSAEAASGSGASTETAPPAPDSTEGGEPPKEAGEAKPESAVLRSIRKREAKLEAERKAVREQTAAVEAREKHADAAVASARAYAEQVQKTHAGLVDALKTDPLGVLEKLGHTKKDIAARLLGAAPQVDSAARRETEAIRQELDSLKKETAQGAREAQARAAQEAQARAEQAALSTIQTDPSFKYLAKIAKVAPSAVLQELNEAAGRLAAAGKSVPLGELIRAVERRHASLASIYGEQVTPGTATGVAGATVAASKEGEAAKPPTLSSRGAAERSTVKSDMLALELKDPKAANAAVLAAAEAARKTRR